MAPPARWAGCLGNQGPETEPIPYLLFHNVLCEEMSVSTGNPVIDESSTEQTAAELRDAFVPSGVDFDHDNPIYHPSDAGRGQTMARRRR